METGTVRVKVTCITMGTPGQLGNGDTYGMGRSTYEFVRRAMRDPVLRDKIQARAKELGAEK